MQTKTGARKKEEFQIHDPVNNLWAMLVQTKDIIATARGIELKSYGISRIQSQVLFMLAAEDRELTIEEISGFTYRTHQATLNLMNRMQKRGLIQKAKRPSERKLKIAITSDGRELVQKIAHKSIYMIFSVLSESEQEQLLASLKKLRTQARHLLGLDYKPPFLP